MFNAASLFSADYTAARAIFLDVIGSKKGRLQSFLHPSAKAPQGQDLYIDVASFGPSDASKALLVISGTHGVEAYAGSAVQCGWISSRLTEEAVADCKIVFVHALNPYGFAWNRRVTEENVDLNRCFIDREAPLPENDDYELLALAIAPPDLETQTLDAASRSLRAYAKQHGAFKMQETISKGQYTCPDGIYFGGSREPWSARMFKQILETEFSQCNQAAVVDIHTGLGDYGKAELISEEETSTAHYLRARQWWGEEVCSTQSGESSSPHITGSIDSEITRFFSNREVTMICLEYGTYSTWEVFQALRADNWLHTRSRPNTAQAEAITSQIRRAFYPDQDDWKKMIWKKGEKVVDQALSGLKSS